MHFPQIRTLKKYNHNAVIIPNKIFKVSLTKYNTRSKFKISWLYQRWLLTAGLFSLSSKKVQTWYLIVMPLKSLSISNSPSSICWVDDHLYSAFVMCLSLSFSFSINDITFGGYLWQKSYSLDITHLYLQMLDWVSKDLPFTYLCYVKKIWKMDWKLFIHIKIQIRSPYTTY